ncbi:MAG: lysoplasmalogenase family protein [Burkholderiales bacterium]
MSCSRDNATDRIADAAEQRVGSHPVDASQCALPARCKCRWSPTCCAWHRWRRGEPRGGVLAIGGALFVACGALRATNQFAWPLPLASLWILTTYWAAQWRIASWLPPRANAGSTSPAR